jgi:membrane-associated phospholipid phosphatase
MDTGTPLTLRTALIATGISLLYLLFSCWLIGYKSDELFLVLLFNGLFYLSGRTRRFILGFTVFIVFWVLFDSMKAFPNYRYNTVHIESIYRLEKVLFGVRGGPVGGQMAPGMQGIDGGGRLTPNEFWLAHQQTFLDILSGFFYLCWIPLPLAFAGYLFYKDKEAFFRFALSFLIVNLVGFVVYYICPAAPPWYVEQYGFAFNPHTPGNTAGLGRWDAYFHVHVFAGLYAKSSNVFAAMPSLHSAYPLTVLYYGIRYKMRWWNALFALIMVGIWFAAVYASHHYVLDVLAGIGCGIAGIGLFNYLFGKVGWFTRLVQRWIRAVEPPQAAQAV